MELENACSLAAFINEGSLRFSANVLAFGNRGWVIVADKQTDKYLEPIADAQDYLRRARLGALSLDTAYCDLINKWVTKS